MKRQFSRRETVLLVIFAIMLLGCLYYVLVDQPVREDMADAAERRTAAESDLVIEAARLMQMRQMQAALEKLDLDSSAVVPDYDNVRSVVALFDKALLATMSYDMTFSPIQLNGQIVSRPVTVNFVCGGYDTAIRILRVLYDGPYRCEISSVKFTGGSGAALTDGAVSVAMEITFYEYIPFEVIE